MFELNAEIDGDVQNRLGLAVFVVGKLAGLELDRLAEVGERYLGHTFIVACGIWLYWFFMFHLLEKRIAGAFASRIESLYGVETPVQTEQPKQSSFGEIAVPAAFQLARQLKKAPQGDRGGTVGGGGADRRRRGDRNRRATDT